MNISIQSDPPTFQGPGGTLALPAEDVASRQFAMLVEGQCSDQGIAQVAAQFGYSRQRYYQLLALFKKGGVAALVPALPGPKSNYRRTSAVVRRVIAQRFQDAEVSAAVIAQKLRQKRLPISQRSIERIFADYGLQKKTLRP
jgi:hypothetical protein